MKREKDLDGDRKRTWIKGVKREEVGGEREQSESDSYVRGEDSTLSNQKERVCRKGRGEGAFHMIASSRTKR